MKPETMEEAWDMCLALWKELSEMEDQKTRIRCRTDVRPTRFKLRVLRKLKLIGQRQYISHGCPFCEIHLRTGECPFNNCDYEVHCTKSPYGEWTDCVEEDDMHIQKYAKAFYDYLLKLKEDNDGK